MIITNPDQDQEKEIVEDRNLPEFGRVLCIWGIDLSQKVSVATKN